ncbi:hypothetical protein T09_13821 [Trichinella sp. T9]|nr:hypothetical protein T09_13821 [Trichinella sp. T9]
MRCQYEPLSASNNLFYMLEQTSKYKYRAFRFREAPNFLICNSLV